jgi:hypothetical protein
MPWPFGKLRAKSLKHEKEYRALENGAGKIVCSCGWESPAVDDSTGFTLGRKQRSVESYFKEHLATEKIVDTMMREPATEQAVTPAQKPSSRRKK